MSLLECANARLAGGRRGAGELVVVANPSIGQAGMTAGPLKQVFPGAKTSMAWTGVEPVPGMPGKGSMPKGIAADAAIVRYVARPKGAIGYAATAASLAGVKQPAVR